MISQISAQPSESDPWNWGWDDNTNSNTQAVTETVNPTNVAKNTITESFANDESWNWTVDDNNSAASQSVNTNHLSQHNEQVINQIKDTTTTSQNVDLNNEQQHSNITKDIPAKVDSENNDSLVQNSEHNQDFYSNSSQPVDIVEDLPPSMPSVRRVMNDNLTPQWSIESQVSQDSSEDVLLTSESDNRSNILSQSSTTSQSPSLPASSHEVNTNEYLPQTYRYDTDNVAPQPQRPADNVELANREIYHHQENSQSLVDNVDKAMQELSLNAQFENKEIVTPEMASQPPKEEAQQPPKDPTPPPPPKKMTPPLLPPPAQGTSDKNPYKRNTGLSHKSAIKMLAAKEPVIASTVSQNIEPSPVFLQNTTSAFSQPPPRPTDNLGVNLETLPDNSERPDQMPTVETVQKTVRKTSTVQPQWAENCEIAPINDRNQYLETGQLSDADVPVYSQSGNDNQQENIQGTSADNSDSLPPPGLRRLVLGQMEQSDTNQVVDNAVDEPPPPGLSRMVLGSTAMETKKNNVDAMLRRLAESFPVTEFQNNEEPPAGLHRMIPGESSSPESSSRQTQPIVVQGYMQTAVFRPAPFDDADNYVSESELNQMNVTLVSQRSATIGADTPPVTNQQAISNTGYSSSSSVDPITSREGAVGIDNNDKQTDKAGSNTTDDNYSAGVPSDNNRREAIDGGPVDEISPVRDQTVGQNATDSVTSVPNQTEKHRSRNYTTDSEQDQPKERHNRGASPGGRYDKDRRYYEDRRERRDRDSPDRFRGERDRKYDKRRHKDRRYEEDTDYYSDKERSERRHKEEREEYDRRYSSLRRDKERDRRRDRGDRREYERDDRRSDYYYNGRYDDEYYANR